jgi:polar amino acid transport system substrate-binding protein
MQPLYIIGVKQRPWGIRMEGGEGADMVTLVCRCRGWLSALALLGTLALPAAGAAPEPFVMGTDMEETKPLGQWYRRIYGEAFRRLGVPLTVVVAPTARLTILADQGEIHGQASRVFGYADGHPDQVRVEETLHEVRLALFTAAPPSPSADPRRTEDLASGRWTVEYRRGVAICEKLLAPVVPPEQLSDVTSVEQALKKLKSGRADLYCDFDTAVRNELLTPAFKGSTGFRQALDLNVGLPLYPYLHRSQAELAPRLAETLRKMKAEGLIDRYLRDVEREARAAPLAQP